MISAAMSAGIFPHTVFLARELQTRAFYHDGALTAVNFST